jgi:spore coat polysaccharide biosynthesis predicted glycosyltransferase SpsG
VATDVVFVADAGREAGLGHISRSSALAVAVRCRGAGVKCYAFGVDEDFERDGITWLALHRPESALDGRVLVLDSYRLDDEARTTMTASRRFAVMHDYGGAPERAALIVAAAGTAPTDDPRWLAGLRYAALRPSYWGLPPRVANDDVRRILVTTGGGELSEIGATAARAIRRAIPGASVTLVLGPHAGPPANLAGIDVLDAPESLADEMLESDLVVTAGGQTMLEAAATGAACIAVPLVDNQLGQTRLLAAADAICTVDEPDADRVASLVADLAGNAARRRKLGRNAQDAVDGYGALRVAFQIARLLDD